MDSDFQKEFELKWQTYFGNAELPICMWFASETNTSTLREVPQKYICLIGKLNKVRKGQSLCVDRTSIGCRGASYFLGYSQDLKPDFEYFLSCGNKQTEGERYVRTPEEVVAWLNMQPQIPPHNRYAHFKRWDKLEKDDVPELLIFFANPDVLSGLYALFNFCNFRENNIEAPFGSGCSSIITKPYLNSDKAFIGMFDPAARKFIPSDMLTFSFHYKHIESMIEAMDQSFLTTTAWKIIKQRMTK